MDRTPVNDAKLMAFPPVLLLHGCNPQVVQVTGSSGWSFEFSLRPGSDQALLDKYSIVDCIQVGGCMCGEGGLGGQEEMQALAEEQSQQQCQAGRPSQARVTQLVCTNKWLSVQCCSWKPLSCMGCVGCFHYLVWWPPATLLRSLFPPSLTLCTPFSCAAGQLVCADGSAQGPVRHHPGGGPRHHSPPLCRLPPHQHDPGHAEAVLSCAALLMLLRERREGCAVPWDMRPVWGRSGCLLGVARGAWRGLRATAVSRVVPLW